MKKSYPYFNYQISFFHFLLHFNITPVPIKLFWIFYLLQDWSIKWHS